METCHFSEDRRGFIKKSMATAALYLFPSTFVQSFAIDNVVPTAPKEKVSLIINGKPFELEVDARMTLLNFLREQIGYTGTKKGCEMGQCGACTVHINGKRMKSCILPLVAVQNAKVTTIEGVAQGEALHAMQASFVKHDAFQCGYCTSGQIMSAIACVREGKATSRASIQSYMDFNLCRCGAYQNIVDAIEEVAKSGISI